LTRKTTYEQFEVTISTPWRTSPRGPRKYQLGALVEKQQSIDNDYCPACGKYAYTKVVKEPDEDEKFIQPVF
jgi:hypothetical protein